MTQQGIDSSQSSRIKALQVKRSLLSMQIREGHGCPTTSDFYLAQLKKRRLHYKDEIQLLRSRSEAT